MTENTKLFAHWFKIRDLVKANKYNPEELNKGLNITEMHYPLFKGFEKEHILTYCKKRIFDIK